MSAVATATEVRLHVGLYVADLSRAVRFYQTLFGAAPVKFVDDYARFESERPPLTLALTPAPQSPGGSLNHLGFRLENAGELVELQRRLEQAGIATQRQDGVECCYARQTKFWVADPDRNLWELYIFEADIDHSGFDDPPAASALAEAPPGVVWEHRLTEPVPERIPHPDSGVDEVHLEGSFNGALPPDRLTHLLSEARRALRPGGVIAVRGLCGDRPFPGTPALPGIAAVVRSLPTWTEVLDVLSAAGFTGLRYEKLGDIHCFKVGGVELRETRLLGIRPFDAAPTDSRRVVYKGPFERVVDDDGVTYNRGEVVIVPAHVWRRLQQGPAAEQFLVIPAEASGCCS